MRKYWIVPALVVVSVAAWAWSASATSSRRRSASSRSAFRRTTEHSAISRSIGPPASGDQFVVKNALYKNGARVGHVRVLHTFITGFGPDFKRKATVLFVAQLYLHGGTMLGRGVRPGERGRPVEAQVPDRRRHGAICRRARQSGRPQPVAATRRCSSSTFRPDVAARPSELRDREHLHRDAGALGDAAGEFDRLVATRAVDHVEAADGLLRLGEGAVGHDRRLAGTDGRSRRR